MKTRLADASSQIIQNGSGDSMEVEKLKEELKEKEETIQQLHRENDQLRNKCLELSQGSVRVLVELLECSEVLSYLEIPHLKFRDKRQLLCPALWVNT